MIFLVKPKTRLDDLRLKEDKVQLNKISDSVKHSLYLFGNRFLMGKLGSYGNDKWRPGQIINCVSPVTYIN